MSDVTIQVESKGMDNVIKTLETYASRGNNLRPVLRRFGKIIVAGVTKNFEEQGRPSRWKPRSDLTNKIYANQAMFGYMKKGIGKKGANALRKGMTMAVERKLGNLILSGSGDLKKSIDDEVDSYSVKVGSALPYARIHQLGGIITPKKSRALFIPMGNGQGAIRLRRVTIPARPYLVITSEEETQITDTAKLYILTGEVQ